MKNGNEPAYPRKGELIELDGKQCLIRGYEGLTKREYFEGLAMQGQLAFSPHDSFDKYKTPEEVADVAVKYADALLAQLELTKERE